MQFLALTEGGPAEPLDLSEAEARALGDLELVTVMRAPGTTTWLLSPTTKVGVARVGEWQVSVRPKIPINRLLFLMGYAQSPKHWRDRTVHLDTESDLVEALGHSFTRLATRAVEQGLLQGYVTTEESLAVLRGRIRVSEQIARHHGQALPLEVAYDEFTTDIAENQILLAATLRLLRLPGVSAELRTTLQRLRRTLADVTAMRKGDPSPKWMPSRLNVRYQPALHIAEVILRGDSFEQRHGDLSVTGFVVDMWRVFEDFVCVALREAMAADGIAALQHQMYLDEDLQVPMKPDYLWTGFGGLQIVADAKYKAERPSGFPQADVYQLLAYCTALGLNDGHLIYAHGEEQPRSHKITRSAVRIHCHTLDLAKSPTVLLAQIEQLAHRIRHPS